MSPPPAAVTVVPLPGLPEVRPGDDLAALLLDGVAAAGLTLADGDVLVVTSKVVAKAEGRLQPLPADPAERARIHREAVARETARVVARRGELVIAATRDGVVGANALVDASNAGGDALVLPPPDPDGSAARLRAALRAATGAEVAVVVSDTLGRPWRLGQTDAAIGLAGMGALEDYRGRPDADGRTLEVTEIAVADELAAAADLVKGKTARVPAALVRGVPLPKGDGRARDLVRPAEQDLFRSGVGAEDLVAFLEGRPSPRRFLPDPVDPALVERAVLAALTAPLSDRAAPVRVVRLASPAARRRYLEALEAAWRADLAAGGTPAAAADRPGRSRALLAQAPVLLVPCLAVGGADQADGAAAWTEVQLAAGGAVQTLLLALHALGLAGAWIASSLSCQQAAARALELPDGWLPLGSVVAGRPDPDDPPRAPGPPDPARLLPSR